MSFVSTVIVEGLGTRSLEKALQFRLFPELPSLELVFFLESPIGGESCRQAEVG